MAIAGRVAIVPKGDWSADATYKRLDAVTHNNTLYFAKKDVPAGTETSNTEYWSKSVVGGEATVDDTISSESTNPVQNKVVKAYVDKKASENIDFSTSTSKLLNDSIEAQLVLSNATRNLLNPTLQTTTKNGVTCTNNGDGTYTIDTGGSPATGNTIFTLSTFKFNANTKYKLIGCPSGGSNSTYRLDIAVINSDIGNGSDVKFTQDVTYDIRIDIASGTVCDNLIFKPMLTTDLSDTYDDFVPYGGYEIKTCGKNLLNVKSISENQLYDRISVTIENGSTFILNGKYELNIIKDIYFDKLSGTILLKKNKKYIFSADGIVDNIILLFRKVGTYDTYVGLTTQKAKYIITPDKDLLLYFNMNFTGQVDANNLRINVQIEEVSLDATEPTDFEQYQDGGTVHIDSTTKFPLLGLKSFDGETNIISPGNVEVTYAKSDSGKAILDMSENKLDKDNVVNNQTTTVEGFALDARQANPNLDGTLAKQISDLNGSLNKSHMDCLWTGKASNMERVDFSNPISNYPSARMLIFVFHYDVLNYECMFDFPIFNLKTRTNFLANNTEIALSIIPPDQIFDTFCYLTWTSTKDYYLKSVYIEY